MPDYESIDEDIKQIRKEKTKKDAQSAVQSSLITYVTAPKPKAFELLCKYFRRGDRR